MEGVTDLVLLEIAEKIPDNKFRKLAYALETSSADADRYESTNTLNGRVSSQGTQEMLRSWRVNTKEEDQQAQLKRALEKAQLGEIAHQYFGHLNHTNGEGVSGGCNGSMESEMRGLDKVDEEGVSGGCKESLESETSELGKDARSGWSSGWSAYELPAGWSSYELPAAVIASVLGPMQEKLEERYTDLRRIPGNFRGELTFQSVLTRRDGQARSSMKNSRHDIFRGSGEGKHGRRLVVSGDNIAENTALSHILAFDWATQNQASPLSEEQLVFELNADLFRGNQTIEAAIKQQLFRDVEEIGEALIRQILDVMSDGITILVDGFDGKHIRKYGDNIMKILRGQALQEVNVMVTAQPRSADQLHRLAKGVYDHIDML